MRLREIVRQLREAVEPSWLVRAETELAYLIASRLPRSRPRTGRKLLLAPFLKGSRGDEALLLGAVAAAGGELIILSDRPNRRLRAVLPPGHRVWTVFGLLYALPPFSFIATLILLIRVRAADSFTVVGADVLDGAYWLGPSLRRILIPIALSKIGVRTEIVGFSWRANSSPECETAIQETSGLVKLTARDELTVGRLQALGVDEVSVGVDCALALFGRRYRPEPELLRWISQQRESGRKILVLGPNGQTLYRKAELQVLLDLIRRADQSWSLAVVPMDERFFAFDRARSKSIEKLALQTGVPVFVTRKDTGVEGLIGSLSRVDAIVTFRMHLAILGLTSGTPCIGIEYNDKFQGVFRAFGVEELVVKRENLVADVPRVFRHMATQLDSFSHTVRMASKRILFPLTGGLQ